MGEHKFNPTAIAAKNGELPPKPKKMSKLEKEYRLYAQMQAMFLKPFVVADIETQKDGEM